MIKFKTFKLSESEEINEFLKNYNISSRLSFFGYQGEICIPFENGEPMNDKQKIIALKDQKNLMSAQYDTILFSNNVIKKQIENLKKQIQESKDNLIIELDKKDCKERYIANKTLEEQIKLLGGNKTNLENTIKQNISELSRMEANFETFDEEIKKLSS